MAFRLRIALACLTVLVAAGCARKPPDLSDIPEPKPPPGYAPPPQSAPGAPAGQPGTAPQMPAPPKKDK